MACLLKIRSLRSEMSSSEKKLADYILDNSQLLRDYSSQQLANAVGISQSSVVKFSQKLGYKGYPDLKLAVNESVAKGLSNNSEADQCITESDNISAICEHYSQKKYEACVSLAEINTDDNFHAAINLLANAEKVLIVSDDNLFPLAQQFAEHMACNKWVMPIKSVKLAHDYLHHFAESDLILVLNLSGKGTEQIQVAQLAKARAAKVLSLTQYGNNAVASEADVNLFVLSESAQSPLMSLLNYTNVQHVLELLTVLYAQLIEKQVNN